MEITCRDRGKPFYYNNGLRPIVLAQRFSKSVKVLLNNLGNLCGIPDRDQEMSLESTKPRWAFMMFAIRLFSSSVKRRSAKGKTAVFSPRMCS
jgi:hypothetical protein